MTTTQTNAVDEGFAVISFEDLGSDLDEGENENEASFSALLFLCFSCLLLTLIHTSVVFFFLYRVDS